jgi:hypothetical protein
MSSMMNKNGVIYEITEAVMWDWTRLKITYVKLGQVIKVKYCIMQYILLPANSTLRDKNHKIHVIMMFQWYILLNCLLW